MSARDKTRPRVGMRVRLIVEHRFVTKGTGGIIDVVSEEDEDLFWVATDCGGFFGWTTFASWEPVAEGG